MKKIFLLVSLLSFSLMNARGSSIKFYGLMESEFNGMQKMTYQGLEYGEFGWGWSNYANFRIKADIGEYLTFGAAFNINLLAGNYTEIYQYYAKAVTGYAASAILNPASITDIRLTSHNFFTVPFYYKSTYIGSFELDRLYFKAGNRLFDIETGLIRIARGYGYSFSPMDLFNPKNPTNLSARPEGRLALNAAFYPLPMWKIEAFMIAPDDPIGQKGWGFKFGHSTKLNLDKVNLEFLYALFLPEVERTKDPSDYSLPAYTNNDFVHIAGLSLKADVEVGLYIEAIYRFEQRAMWTGNYYGNKFIGYEGLEASLGADYTVNIPGTYMSFYFLLEYMFYGAGMINWKDKKLDDLYLNSKTPWYKSQPFERLPDPQKKPLYLARHNYLFGMIRFKINNYISYTPSYLFGIDDQSGILIHSFDIEPFQAFTITISSVTPLGWEIIDHTWAPGEFGPTNLGYMRYYKITAKLRF